MISKDLINYKNRIFNDNNKLYENDINSNDYKEKNNFEFYLDGNNISKDSDSYSEEVSLKINEEKINFNIINGLFKTINYINKYSKMKQGVKNEKYIILFTDFLNYNFDNIEKLNIKTENLEEDKDIIFLLVGENEKTSLEKEKDINNINYKYFEELILNKFGEKSELIYFENMKKIKTILSNNDVIKEEIIYPNEVYN